MKLKVVKWLASHSEIILTGVSIGGTVAAVYFALKDGPKCNKILEELNEEEASNVEKAKAVGKTMYRTGIAAAVSIGASLLNHKFTMSKIHTLADGYLVMQHFNKEREEAEERVLGPDKKKDIDSAVAGKHLRHDSIEGSKVIATGHGNGLFYDAWSGRYFLSDVNYIKKVVNDKNYQLRNDMFISLNEFYNELGLPRIDAGNEMGWNIDYGQIDVIYTAELDECDQPYTYISFAVNSMPCYKYGSGRY